MTWMGMTVCMDSHFVQSLPLGVSEKIIPMTIGVHPRDPEHVRCLG